MQACSLLAHKPQLHWHQPEDSYKVHSASYYAPSSRACITCAQHMLCMTTRHHVHVSGDRWVFPRHTEYIKAGPLMGVCGLEVNNSNLDEWLLLGQQLALNLEFDHELLNDIQKWVVGLEGLNLDIAIVLCS